MELGVNFALGLAPKCRGCLASKLGAHKLLLGAEEGLVAKAPEGIWPRGDDKKAGITALGLTKNLAKCLLGAEEGLVTKAPGEIWRRGDDKKAGIAALGLAKNIAKSEVVCGLTEVTRGAGLKGGK
jgi:hypothetical protein